MSLFGELKRRNVLRVGTAYAVTAWLVIQVVETIAPAFGFGDAAVRVVTILSVIGLVPALVLTWVFELTPEGLKKEKDVDHAEPAPPGRNRKLDYLIFVVLFLALGFFVFDYFVLDPQRVAALESEKAAAIAKARDEARAEADARLASQKSIAVLAFEDMSPGKDQQYMSDGIAEELLNLLVRTPDLRVISRSSAFSYRGRDVTVPRIAADLGVSHILEGSVRTDGDRVRITAQLVDGRTDSHLWSGTYDRTLGDIFAIQDEIAAAVVTELSVRFLGPTPQARETVPEAYSLFLQAGHTGRQGTAEAFDRAIAMLEEALALDPEYAPAWERLAGIYVNQAGVGILDFAEGIALARDAADKALAIDPDYAQAHDLLGWIELLHNDFAASAAHFSRALELEPTNPSIVSNASALLSSLGRFDEAIALQEYQVDRDPVAPVGHANLGASYLMVGRWKESVASSRTTLRLSPDYVGAHYYVGLGLLFDGDAAGALAEIEQESSPIYRQMGLPVAYHALGRVTDSDTALTALIEEFGDEAAAYIASVYACRGEPDPAFAWLDKAVEVGDPGLLEVAWHPLYRKLHADPRWLPFLRKVGYAPEQLAAIEFEVTLPAR